MPELSPELERAASDLWRKENPEMSVFDCDAAMKERYRKRVAIECPCCRGQRFLWIFNEGEPGLPSAKVGCCHCAGLGVVAPDNRSMNAYE